ncbi:MAG: peptidylprolyl isomerase [Gallionella sp.]
MKFTITACVIGACLIAAAAEATAADNDAKSNLAKPYVTINGFTQPNARAEVLLREQIARGVTDSQQLRDGVRDLLINQALMEQEAYKEGLDKEVLIQAQIDLARQNILAQAWQQKVLSGLTIKDSDTKSEYDHQIARLGTKEYLVRHLLVGEESTAKLLLEKIQAGAKLADLSKEYSHDAGTSDKGGLTDWTAQGNLLPPLSAAIKGLNKGQVVDHPVKTEAGWHVVQVEDVRPFKAPTMEDLKPQLTQIVTRRQLEAKIKALRDGAKIE